MKCRRSLVRMDFTDFSRSDRVFVEKNELMPLIRILYYMHTLLPPASEGWGKVMLSQASVCPHPGGGGTRWGVPHDGGTPSPEMGYPQPEMGYPPGQGRYPWPE